MPARAMDPSRRFHGIYRLRGHGPLLQEPGPSSSAVVSLAVRVTSLSSDGE
jgi:hypothetical protein